MNDKVKAALEARKKKKEKEYSTDKVKAALKSREERINKDKDSILSDIQNRYSSVMKDYTRSAEGYKPSYGEKSFTDTLNKHRTQTIDTSKLKKDIEAYRKYIGNDDAVNEMISNLDTISGGYRGILENSRYHSQFKDETDQTKFESNWLNPDAKEDTAEQRASRKGIYEGNKTRISEIDAEISKASGKKKKSLESEKKKLEEENRKYDRTQGKVDSYAYLYDQEDFEKSSANRDFKNPTRDDLKYEDIRMDSSTWYTDANGTMYNALGEVVADNDIYGIEQKSKHTGEYYLKNKAKVDRLGLYLSTDEDAWGDAVGNNGTWEDIINAGIHGNWEQLREEEINAYYYLLNTEGYEAADKYLDDMTYELNRRATEEYNEHLTELFEDANPLMRAALNVASVAVQPLGNIGAGIEDAFNIITGNDINPYSSAHSVGNFSSQVRSLQAEAFDEATGNISIPLLDFTLGDAYQAGMSYLDMLTAAVTGSTGYAVQMGAGAFSDKATELYEQGASMGEVGTLGAIAGIAEGFFEKYSIDNLIELKDAKTLAQGLKNIAVQGGIEASEEMATEATNIIADAIIRDGASNWNKLLEESNGNVLAALGKELQQIGKAGVSGFIAGALGGGASSVASGIGYNAEVTEHGQNILDNRGYEDLKALALSMSEEASGIKSLDKAIKKAETKTTAKNVGRLSEQVSAVKSKQNNADVVSALVDRGMSKRQAQKTAQQIIEVAEKNAAGVEITQAEYDAVTKSGVVNEVYRSLISDTDSSINTRNLKHSNERQGIKVNEDGTVTSSEGRTSRIMDRVVQEVALENISSKSRFKANTGIVEEASDDDIDVPMTAEDAAVYKGKTTYTNPDSGETKVVDIEGISKIENGEMTLKLKGGETVNASDVRFASEGEALVYSTVLDMGVNAGVAEALVNEFKASGNVNAGVYALGIKDAYAYGRMSIPLSQLSKSSFAYSLSDTQRQYVYNLAQNEVKSETKAKQEAINTKVTEAKKGGIKTKSGNIIAEDGVTVAENGEIDESSLTDVQKANLVGVKALAELSPINFHIFQSKKVDGKWVATINGEVVEGSPNGVYFKGTNDIWIDLNAGDMGEGTMLWTAAHEISHYIRERSPAKWKAMADFLMKEYAKQQGVSISDMLDNQKAKIMARPDAGTKTETEILDEAYEDLVSNALSDMLTDGSVINALADLKQKNKGLWQTIKDAIADLLKRWGEILGVYKGRTHDTAEAQALAGMEKAYKKLQKMYAEAFAEANLVEEAQAYLKENGIEVVADGKQEAASLNSVRNLLESDQKQKVAKTLAERFEVTEKEAMEWLTAETSLASLILNPKYSQYLDYEADASEDAIKKNSDYPQGTVDFSNICKKRRAFTAVMGKILRNFPNHVFMATDLAKIRTIMEQEGMEVACAICYVEDRRQLDSIVGQNFLDSLELYRKGSKTRPDGKAFNAQQLKAFKLIEGDNYTPSIYELVTLEGRNELKAKNPNMESAWVTFNNARGMQSVRLLTNEAEYDRQILKYNKKTVQSKNDLGGLRIYSFSDMEMFHLIDIIQVITDSASVGLMIQGYTKVNEYAKAVKDTGEKLNRSLIPKGDLGYHIEDGKVVLDFDTVEGIDINHPDFFDSTDNPDVGNIVIGINETQIRAAMVSEFIDYIIPFHTGQSKEVLGEKGIAEWNNYEDSQSERDIATGKKSSHQINIYTEVIQAAEKEGKPIKNKVDFVNKFLAVCKENGLKPRFSEFLNIGENGDYVYTEGYHKFLVDFKTFDPKTGEYLPQKPVKPIFENGYITRLLEDYVETQKTKDAELAKSMPKVIDRITKEVVKPKALHSDRNAHQSFGIKSINNYVGVQKAVLSTLTEEGFFSDGNNVVVNADSGMVVEITKDGIRETLGKGSRFETLPRQLKELKLSTIRDLPSLIETAKLDSDNVPNYHKSESVLKYAYLSNDIVVEDGATYTVTITVRKSPQKNMFWIHEIRAIKKEQGLSSSEVVNPQQEYNKTLATDGIISQDSDPVKKLFSERNTAPTFYSYMGKVVDGIKTEKIGAGGVVPYLKGKGVKNEEIKWSGIEAFLEGKKSLTKQDLQEFIAGSMLQIGEQMSSNDFDLRYDTPSNSYSLYDPNGNVIDTFTYNDFIGGLVSEATDEIYSNSVELEDALRDEYGSMSSPKWANYKLDGGENYRELVFTMPNSTYTNRAMKVHWGQDAEGVLAHARIQDFVVDGKKILFVEEIQSDWHNEGQKKGYLSEEYENASETYNKLAEDYAKFNRAFNRYARSSEFNRDPADVRKKKFDWLRNKMEVAEKKKLDAENKLDALREKGIGDTPDAPFRSNYHEFVLKRLIRMASEEGYDSIGWTPADIQSKRYSDEYAEGYRIEYDQDIPKFLNKYGKKWGTKVGTSTIGDTEVWSMPITDSMKDSVLYEGQALYSERNTDSNRALLANALETTVQNEVEANKLKEYKEKISLIDAEQQRLAEINAQIKELSFAKGKRDTEKLKSLRFDAVQAANRINTYDRQLLNLESTKVLKAVLNREKGLAMKRQKQKNAEALKEYRGKVVETRDKRESVKKLQKLILDTAKWVSYPAKDDVKVPDILKAPYADFLESIDLSSKRSLKGGEATQNDMRIASAMNSLATAIEQIKTAQNPTADTKDVSNDALDAGYLDLPVNFIVNLRKMAENITKMMIPGTFVVNTMSSQDIKQISKLIRTLNHSIREMSTMYANLRFSHVEEAGDHTVTFLEDIGETKSTNAIADFVSWDNALPFYAFKRFGEAGESIFEELMDAQDKLAFLADTIFKFKEKNWTDKEAKAWGEDTHTITLPSGNEITLTTADAMGIYCLSRREQAVPHLLGGGIRVVGQKKGVKQASDSRSTLTMEDLVAINSSLTKRQRQVAEAIQEFMSTVCADWGNEISMKRFLTREFREKYYYPIESSDENLPVKDQAAQQADLYRLLNISATKPLTEGANNAVVIRNIFEVFTNHASDMAKLNAYGMALLDYMKWVNFREKSSNEQGQLTTRGVRQAMNSTYGDKAFSYVLNLIKDVNGRYNDGGDHAWLMKMTRSAKTASVGNSLRVAVLQVTAYPRAGLILSQKSLALGLTKKPQIKKAQKYSGIALWKSFGFYDTNIARSLEDQIKGNTNIKQKLIEWSLKGAEIGDALTWGLLWNACEYEVSKTNKSLKAGSEEFNQAVGKKLREVVYATQVVDSILTRSQIMRNKSGLTQSATAFMSEPTVSANILMDAGFQFHLEKRRTGSAKAAWKKTGKHISRALAIYSVGQITAALIESLTDAYRDDDDEEFYKKFLEAFKENAISDLMPFNKIPIISDIAEFVMSRFNIGFFSSDNLSTTWLSQLANAYDTWVEVLSEDTSKTVYNAIYNTTRAISSMTGIAGAGLMREAVTLWNNTAGAYDSTLKVKTYENTTAENGKLLYDAIVSGDEKQAERLKGQFEDEESYQRALRNAVKEEYKSGTADRSTATKILSEHLGMEEDDIHWLFDKWDHADDEDYSKYGDFYSAVEIGKNLKDTIKVYLDNGVSEETLARQITTHFKPIYREASNSERAKLKGYLLNAYALLGKRREDKSKDINDWLKND